MFNLMISNITQYSPHYKLIVISNPMYILIYITWKLGVFPKNHVIGSGCNLDVPHFHFLIDQTLVIYSESCHGQFLKEHGNSSASVWSGVSLAGVLLKALTSDTGTERS